MFIFIFLSELVNLFSLLCLAHIILTWIPAMAYSKVTYYLSKICSPYLNFFKRFRIFIIAGFDFTPALGLCTLGAVSSVLRQIAVMQSFSLGFALSLLVFAVWGVISSILNFLTLMIVVRLIIVFIKGEGARASSAILNQLDFQISKLAYILTRPFSMGKTLRYRTALIIAILILIFINIAGGILISFLTGFLMML